jgi:gas vesicle protein
MAYEYDRFEREDGGGSFLMGLLAGTVLGAGLGMLFAPKPGAELRSQLGEQTGRLRSTANDAYSQASEKVHQMVDRGREAYDRARTGAQETTGGGSTMGSGTGTTGSVGTGTTGGVGTGTTGGVGTSASGTGNRTGVGTPSGLGTEKRG